MHAWEAIDQSVNYIEAHISEELDAKQLAEQVYLSTFYFQRLFKRLVHKSVKEYIKLRRLAISVDLLNNTDWKIIEIANHLGVSDHSNFTRMFKETYHLTPEEYREKRPRMNMIRRPNLALNYLLVDEKVPLIINGIVLEIEKRELTEERYVGIEGVVSVDQQLPIGQQTGIDQPGELWQRFYQEKPLLKGIVDEAVEAGISFAASHSQTHFGYFVGGKELDRTIVPPIGWVIKRVPSGYYLVCKIEAETKEMLVTNALNEAYRYLFDVWFPKHEIKVEAFSVERYQEIASFPTMELCLKIKNSRCGQ